MIFGYRIFNESASRNHLEQKEHHSGKVHICLGKKQQQQQLSVFVELGQCSKLHFCIIHYIYYDNKSFTTSPQFSRFCRKVGISRAKAEYEINNMQIAAHRKCDRALKRELSFGNNFTEIWSVWMTAYESTNISNTNMKYLVLIWHSDSFCSHDQDSGAHESSIQNIYKLNWLQLWRYIFQQHTKLF